MAKFENANPIHMDRVGKKPTSNGMVMGCMPNIHDGTLVMMTSSRTINGEHHLLLVSHGGKTEVLSGDGHNLSSHLLKDATAETIPEGMWSC